MIHFVGAGPGAPDLITLRGAALLGRADVVIYAGSLVNPELLELAPAGCEVHDSSRMTLEQTIAVMELAAREGREVVRLHTGDPSLYGAIREQMACLDELGIGYDDTPGVSSMGAAAAAISAEYTLPGVSQSVIVTRLAGRTPVPEAERLAALAAHGASMVIFLSAGMLDQVQEELLRGGYAPDSPAALVYKASWPEEHVVRTTVGRLAQDGASAGINSTALVLVGDFIKGTGERSRLYDPSFSTGLREATTARAGTDTPGSTSNDGSKHKHSPASSHAAASHPADLPRTAKGSPASTARAHGDKDSTGANRQITLISFTDVGQALARRLANKLGGVAKRCEPGGLARWTAEAFRTGSGLVFVGATGIAVRAIAPHVHSKASDPAVVVVDEQGRFAIPLLSGHLGGANDLAQRIADACGATAVITTATDGRGVFAVDEWARLQGWIVANPGRIKHVSGMLLSGKEVRLWSDWPLPPDAPDGIARATSRDEADWPLPPHAPDGIACATSHDEADVVLSAHATTDGCALHLVPRVLVVGVGCKRGTTARALRTRLRALLNRCGYDRRAILRVCSVDAKTTEPGLLELCEQLGVPFVTFSAKELAEVPGTFASSPFVQATVGVDNVCERSAVLGSHGGKLLCGKDAGDGVTLALAEAPLSFDWRWSRG